MNTSVFRLFNLADINCGKYTSGVYSGMYYIEMGTAPQSYAGTATAEDDYISAMAIVPSKTWIDGGVYYTDTNNPNIQYVLKNSKYYLVEPIRWIIIADENYTGTGGTLGIDYFSNTTIKTSSPNDKAILTGLEGRQIVVMSERLLTNFSFYKTLSNYVSQMNSLRDKIITSTEKTYLKNVTLTTQIGYNNNGTTYSQDFWLMAGYSTSSENFHVSNYLTTTTKRQASNTAYLANATTNPTESSDWGTRSYFYTGNSQNSYIDTFGSSVYGSYSGTDYYPSRGIRPAFIINLDI